MLQTLFWNAGGPLFRLYFSIRAQGLENLPQDRPYLIAANYTSHLNALAIFLALRSQVEQLSLATSGHCFFRAGLPGWLCRTLVNAVPFERGGDFRESLSRIRAVLGERRPLLVFPEGTRSASGQLQPFKTGVGLVALELDLPIVPVHLSGPFSARPPRPRRLFRCPVQLLFGPPLEMAPYQGRDKALTRYEIYREIVETLRREIEVLTEKKI